MQEKHLKILCEDLLKKPIETISTVTGGDINQTYQIETKEGTYFCKTNDSEIGEDLLLKEQLSLKVLGRYSKVPTVIASAPNVLVLSWIKSTNKTRRFWQNLGKGLADIHKVTFNKFGFDHNNYIGTLQQSNERQNSWSQFYLYQRLLPQLKLAVNKGLLSTSDFGSPELMEKIINLVCPSEAASLVHGDLWSGNILCNEDSEAFFVDPCVSYSHREMDIAMSMLFGKFDKCFFDSYEELNPLAPNFKDRIDIYQLYYLLAHLNMFGMGYKNDVVKILKRYFC